MEKTFAVIQSGQLCAMAGYFLVAREDLLPDLFRWIVANETWSPTAN
ncbi:MAG: hypothetical protein CMJ59_15935 [Planctomycetaceae bacterium]|nr:hypothetical protein [Planctomycetaceae bacterium]